MAAKTIPPLLARELEELKAQQTEESTDVRQEDVVEGQDDVQGQDVDEEKGDAKEEEKVDYRALYLQEKAAREAAAASVVKPEPAETVDLDALSDLDLADADEPISQEDLDAMPALVPLIKSLARAEARALIKQLLPEINTRVAKLKTGVQAVAKRESQRAEQEFMAKIAAAVPDLDELKRDKVFTAFIRQQASEHPQGVTYANLLNGYFANRRFVEFTKLIEKCRKEAGIKKNEVNKKDELDKYARPSVGTQSPVKVNGKKPAFPEDEYNRLLDKMTKGGAKDPKVLARYQELRAMRPRASA